MKDKFGGKHVYYVASTVPADGRITMMTNLIFRRGSITTVLSAKFQNNWANKKNVNYQRDFEMWLRWVLANILYATDTRAHFLSAA